MLKIMRNSVGNHPTDVSNFTNTICAEDKKVMRQPLNSSFDADSTKEAMDVVEVANNTVGTINTSEIQQLIQSVRNVCLKGYNVMLINDFEAWMEALKTDNVLLVKQVLQIASKEEKNILLNGQFEYNYKPDKYRKISEQVNPEIKEGVHWKRPLMIAVGCLSLDVVELLLTNSECQMIDIFIRDYDECNILHAIVNGSKFWKHREDEFMLLYCKIMKHLPLEKKKQLLFAENIEGLRPLEVAVFDGQLGLFKMMMSECDVYRFEQGHVGMHKEVFYDVTEYECWRHPKSRRTKSPLMLLRSLSYSALEKNTTKDCFNWHVMNMWLHVKFSTNLPLLIMWFLWRVAMCIALYFVDFKLFSSNSTGRNTTVLNGETNTTMTMDPNVPSSCAEWYTANLWQSILMTTYAILVIFLDIYEVLAYICCDHVTVSDLLFTEDKANHHFFYR